MRTSIITALGLFAGLTSPAIAAGDGTGNDNLEFCRKFAAGATTTSQKEAYYIGDCAGTISTLVSVGRLLETQRRFCLPATVTDRQAMNVVVAFMDAHPQRLHEPTVVLAIDAMRASWPCTL